jgi:hypothetical protein
MKSIWLPVIRGSRQWSLLKADHGDDDGSKVNVDEVLWPRKNRRFGVHSG